MEQRRKIRWPLIKPRAVNALDRGTHFFRHRSGWHNGGLVTRSGKGLDIRTDKLSQNLDEAASMATFRGRRFLPGDESAVEIPMKCLALQPARIQRDSTQ